MKKFNMIKIRGVKYFLLDKPNPGCDGHCESPKSENPCMYIPKKGKTQDDLETIIHELLHAYFWMLSEDNVTENAKILSYVLWAHFLRKNKKHDKEAFQLTIEKEAIIKMLVPCLKEMLYDLKEDILTDFAEDLTELLYKLNWHIN
jgi:hypothetical protein